ncbi:M48 family metallopeptidase [Chromobacterium sp. IIBBL 290-4]|uniref:M48 family metallopeptidase n=1 Tax=Chromobacterium sp. IIBBL 290-4 TaxID=2953890 RepID=UPI0020B8E65A|nr:SprT family zinc-dependent metalloprotease [Chromobacterium sp. IIBBL 290-4]UTH73017.1 M48 family metallopeptidase [Chromobacterium sp. IIBBL 290-4]
MKNDNVWRRLPLPDGDAPVVLIRRRRKSIGIKVQNGVVELIAAPEVSLIRLNQVLELRRDWIVGHLLRQRDQLAAGEDLSTARLQGEALTVKLAGGARKTAKREGSNLLVFGVQAGDAAALKAVAAKFLKREAAILFPARLIALAAACRRKPTGLQLSSARSRWGSCTSDGRIRLNWRLIQAPPAVIDYVIAHELAHLEHMNHSPAFWAETERLHPGWREARRWLKQHGGGLFVFD